jgi:TonB family protein
LHKTPIIILAVLSAAASLCAADPRFGSLRLTSEPDSAQVFLDGTLRGTTPLEVPAIPPGRHQLVVRKPGYWKYPKMLAFEGGKRTVGNARLVAVTQAERDSAHAADSLRAVADGRPVPDKDAYVAVDKSPRLVKKVDPIYPVAGGDEVPGGKVFVQMLIDVDGRVLRADIAKSSGSRELDDAAVEAALQWVFTPAIAPGDHPVRVWVMQAFTFKQH